MNGWSEELRAIHAEVQDRIAFQPAEVKSRKPEDILVTHIDHGKPVTTLAAAPVKYRQCCNNPRNWKRR